MKLYLQDIVENLSLGNLPEKWQVFEFMYETKI
jgi:hypothetical protein